DLGVGLIGHRRLLLEAIATLRTDAVPAGGRAEVLPPPAVSPGDRDRLSESIAERRQLSVMFCDLVDSTPLSAPLDPEDLGGAHAYVCSHRYSAVRRLSSDSQ